MTVLEIVKNGGATINKNGVAVTLKSGYQVSKRDLGRCFINDFTDKMIDEIVAYGLKRGEYAGFWIENGMVYVDISCRVATKKDALAIGKQNNQISVYDWKNNACVYC